MRAPLEVQAWQVAAGAGVVLPDELAAMYERTERIEAELARVTAEQAEVRDAVADMLAGKPLDVAVEDHRSSAAVRETLDAKRRTAGSAARLSRDQTGKWIGENRDLLIAEHLRPVVAEIMAEAAKLAGKLDRFAPDFDGAEIAAAGTPAVLTAWRDSRTLDERLRVCLAAWVASWNAATSNTPNGINVPGHLRFDEPGGLHVWERPEAVADADVRDGRVLEVLRIAAWHEAGGYRLAGGAEMLELTQQHQTESPWLPGEQAPRRVLIPTGEPVPVSTVNVKRRRAVFL